MAVSFETSVHWWRRMDWNLGDHWPTCSCCNFVWRSQAAGSSQTNPTGPQSQTSSVLSPDQWLLKPALPCLTGCQIFLARRFRPPIRRSWPSAPERRGAVAALRDGPTTLKRMKCSG